MCRRYRFFSLTRWQLCYRQTQWDLMNMPRTISQYTLLPQDVVYLPRLISSLLSMKVQLRKTFLHLYIQAVVNQTISGLACGKPIRGNVAFLGGPLHFLSELRQAFIRTLSLGRMKSLLLTIHTYLLLLVQQ